MIITISGPPGSGKTTVAKGLSNKLNFKYVSAGDVFRQLANEQGVDLEHFSSLAESDPNIDRMIDGKQVEIANTGEDVILDGRLSGWVVRGDLSVWLKAPLAIRAARIAQREEKSYEQALKETRAREHSEAKRYLHIYNIDVFNLDRYDLIINTERWSQLAVIDIILMAFTILVPGET